MPMMRFSSEAASVRATRHFVADILGPTVDGAVMPRLQLAASELATNAVEHARTPFVVGVDLLGSTVRLAVTDGSSRLPVLRRSTPFEVGGTGLALVDTLSARWGVDGGVDQKTVWCEIPLASDSC